MSETKHSPEPWVFESYEGEPARNALVRAANAVIVAVRHRLPGAEHRANMRRLVACVNACKGLSTDALESGVLEKALDALASVEWADNSGDEYRSECPWCKAEGPVAPGWVSHKETPRGGVHTEGCTRQSALRALGRLL